MTGLLISIVALLLLLVVLLVVVPKKQFNPKVKKQGTCSASCGALDPVNDPDYNVREAIKQTLLLEQHLAEKSKYCKSCICKHFLIIEGLYDESVWMACNKCKDYPKLEESEEFIKGLFKKWHANMDDEETRLDTLTKLREWRREMVDLYYFDGKQPDGHS